MVDNKQQRNLVAKLLPDEGEFPLLRVVIYDQGASLAAADLRPCCHAEQVGRFFKHAEASFIQAFMQKTKCDQCDERDDIWLCLTCLACLCSREGGGHGLKHFSETGHCVILSLVTLNFWCYADECYLEHDFYPVLVPLFRKLHEIRHGEEPGNNNGVTAGEETAASGEQHCPHVKLGVATTEEVVALRRPLHLMSCLECADANEAWICLKCLECHCGRFANGHMTEHTARTGHVICMSCKDMSIWCQECAKYLDTFRHPKLNRVYQDLYRLLKEEEPALPEALQNKRFELDLSSDWLDDFPSPPPPATSSSSSQMEIGHRREEEES